MSKFTIVFILAMVACAGFNIYKLLGRERWHAIWIAFLVASVVSAVNAYIINADTFNLGLCVAIFFGCDMVMSDYLAVQIYFEKNRGWNKFNVFLICLATDLVLSLPLWWIASRQ